MQLVEPNSSSILWVVLSSSFVRNFASDVIPLSNPRRRLQERRQQDGEFNLSQ